MDLHRAAAKPDWSEVEHSKRNIFQKVSAATRGLITPANIITIVGLGLVIYGNILLVRSDYLAGLVSLIVGRLLDVVDGLVAEATGTKSLLGEAFDAVADKIGTLLTVGVLIVVGIAPWWPVLAVAFPQIVATLVVAYNRNRGIAVHPTWQGKLSMVTAWLGIGGLILLQVFPGIVLLVPIVYVVIIVSLALGLYAGWQYATARD